MKRIGFVCDSCGGQLTLDTSKQLLMCQFCGVSYDYSYFNESDVLERAESFIDSKEFNAARDALMFLLKKDPHNANALEKLMLITYKLTDESDLKNREIVNSLEGDPKETEWIIDQAHKDSREHLSGLHKKIVTALKCSKIDSEILDIRSKIKECDKSKDEAEIGILNEYIYIPNRYDNSSGETMHPTKYWHKYLWIMIIALIICSLVFLPLCVLKNGLIAFIFMEFMLIISIAAALFHTYSNKINPALEHINDYESKKADLTSEISALKKKEMKLLSEYNALRLSINRG